MPTIVFFIILKNNHLISSVQWKPKINLRKRSPLSCVVTWTQWGDLDDAQLDTERQENLMVFRGAARIADKHTKSPAPP